MTWRQDAKTGSSAPELATSVIGVFVAQVILLHDHHLNRCNLYHHQGHYQGHHSSSSLSSELLLHGCYHCHLYKWEPFLSWDIFKECILSVGDNENKYLEEINPLLFPRLAQVHILIIICHWLQGVFTSLLLWWLSVIWYEPKKQSKKSKVLKQEIHKTIHTIDCPR